MIHAKVNGKVVATFEYDRQAKEDLAVFTTLCELSHPGCAFGVSNYRNGADKVVLSEAPEKSLF